MVYKLIQELYFSIQPSWFWFLNLRPLLHVVPPFYFWQFPVWWMSKKALKKYLKILKNWEILKKKKRDLLKLKPSFKISMWFKRTCLISDNSRSEIADQFRSSSKTTFLAYRLLSEKVQVTQNPVKSSCVEENASEVRSKWTG